MPTSKSKEELQTQVYEALERLAVAFSSAGRLKIIQLLAQAPRSVEELANESGQSVANTSQHLQRLAKEGVVAATKSGVSRIYRIRSKRVLKLWESLQDLAHELVHDINEAEDALTDATLRVQKSAAEVLNEVKSNQAVLLDVRTVNESKSTPLPGAVVVPLEELKNAMKKFPKQKPIYVFCRGRYCTMASEAVKKLRAAGFVSFRLRESPFQLSDLLEGPDEAKPRGDRDDE